MGASTMCRKKWHLKDCSIICANFHQITWSFMLLRNITQKSNTKLQYLHKFDYTVLLVCKRKQTNIFCSDLITPQCRSVVRTTTKVNGKTWNSNVHHTKMAKPIITQLAWITIRREALPLCKILLRSIQGFLTPYRWNCLYSASFYRFFSFMSSSDKLAPRPFHPFWRLIRQMASFRARMCL